MPYVIETRTPECSDPNHDEVRRVAVGTLDEARGLAVDALYAEGGHGERRWNRTDHDGTFFKARTACQSLTEAGGSVGPLPDGTVIQVESVGWSFFGWNHVEDPWSETRRELLAAFNAKQEADRA